MLTPRLLRERNRRLLILASAGTSLVLIARLALPAFDLSWRDSPEVLLVQILLEMFCGVVSAQVVLIAWHAFAFTRENHRLSNTLIYAFTVVAGMNLAHALSYKSMPTLGISVSTPMATFFWFMERCTVLLAICLAALQVQLPGRRWQWQLAGTLSSLMLFAVGTWCLDWIPQPVEEGYGLMSFKSYAEVVLSLASLLVAWYLWKEVRRARRNPLCYLFTACILMGLGELAFASYETSNDLMAILSLLFKASAYGLIYVGVLMLGMRAPSARLLHSEQALRNKQVELDLVLSKVPVGLARLDRQGRYRYVNAQMALCLGRPVEDIVGQTFEQILEPERRTAICYHWALALAGEPSGYEGKTLNRDGQPGYMSIWMVPEFDASHKVVGVMVVVLDITDQWRVQQQLATSLREVADLRTALDAHAIVEITDAKGIITSVNDQFCQISQYSRDELVGQTHRLINSGQHAPSFFHELWRTITDGKVWNGEICNSAKDGSLFWVQTTIVPCMDENHRLLRYVAIRMDITERKRYELQLRELAYQDALTGLPNRRLLMDRLQQGLLASERSGLHGALLFLDLDHFKEINDSLGHEQGDELLKNIARRLRGWVRKSDTVARLGGDEFVVLLGNLGSDADNATARARALCEEILRILSEPYELQESRVTSTPSIGVVMYRGLERPGDTLLKQADIALYEAKAIGRHTLCFFDSALQNASDVRLALEHDLRQALAHGQLVIHYQPIVSQQLHMVGVATLLHWQHPRNGLLAPAQFIPLLEKSGLIVRVGQWVIEQACMQIAAWHEDPERCRWPIAINVDARQLRQPEFVQQVKETLKRFKVGTALLKMEVTENSLQGNLRETVQKMKELHSHGVRFSIDDFGTGYSSLTYLKKLPIRDLKINHSLVRNVDGAGPDATIAKSVLLLAVQLGLEVTAEGVETESQFLALRDYGCQLFQGDFFGRPVPAHLL